MCVGVGRRWRVSIENGMALIEKWVPFVDDGSRWRVVAEIPMEEALAIAKTLMRERKNTLSHEAVAAMEAG